MAEIFSGKQIYQKNGKDVITGRAFKWDDVLDLGSMQNMKLPFDNKQPKTLVGLTHGRTFWMLADYEKMVARWEAYQQGELFLEDLEIHPN